MSPKHYLVVDLEATCCNQKTIPAKEMEIIEIGALMTDVNFQLISSFQSFIRPVRHATLTPFCSQLTSIQQSDVDLAPPFAEVIARFKEWIYRYPNFVFCSWGNYDRKQLEQDCAFHGVSYPIGAEHINLKERFAQQQGLRKKQGARGAVWLAGLEFEGTHHRGIDDARNIARLLPFCLGDARIKPANRS